jgi:predicted dithiol-disulfide oxidoreductase (DUF899 family)
MRYRETTAKLAEYRHEITALRDKMRALQAEIEPEEVADYIFTGPTGAVRLSQLFGDKDTLIVIHNMGKTCPACTMWADGYNGVVPHLESRAAFVVNTPDDPATQAAFAASRGWRFRMVSHQGTDFAEKMGYRSEQGGWLPGISVFKKEGDRILRVSDQRLGPGDDFCSVWHFLDMTPEGWAGWRPRFAYA